MLWRLSSSNDNNKWRTKNRQKMENDIIEISQYGFSPGKCFVIQIMIHLTRVRKESVTAMLNSFLSERLNPSSVCFALIYKGLFLGLFVLGFIPSSSVLFCIIAHGTLLGCFLETPLLAGQDFPDLTLTNVWELIVKHPDFCLLVVNNSLFF